jgi:hypothetical protein
MAELSNHLVKLAPSDWPALYQLMRARKFPHTPLTLAQAKPQLRQATLWGLKSPRGLEAGFIFGPAQDGIAFFDAICTAHAQGQWATRPVLRQLFSQAFASPPRGLGLRALWVQPHGARALRACLGAGFLPVTPLRPAHGAPPVLVMTPHVAPRRCYVQSFQPQ